ncbi:MAG: carbonic anhydrase family protein [Chloroflexota bacterium]
MHQSRKITFSVVSLIVLVLNGLLIMAVAGPTPNVAQAATATAQAEEWTYEGDTGPQHWGDLDPKFAVCAQGRAQSPIDIAAPQGVNLADVAINYQPTALNVVNTGETIKINYDAGSSIVYNEITYNLVQFHFHHPSEHTIKGKAFDLELHLVHQNAAGNLAVIGVLITKGKTDNPAFAPIFDNLPAQAGSTAVAVKLNAADLLPKDRRYYTYLGSLTTPPCTQGVRWLLLTTPIELSEKQIQTFSTIFHLNARPVQALNNRDVLQDTLNGK